VDRRAPAGATACVLLARHHFRPAAWPLYVPRSFRASPPLFHARSGDAGALTRACASSARSPFSRLAPASVSARRHHLRRGIFATGVSCGNRHERAAGRVLSRGPVTRGTTAGGRLLPVPSASRTHVLPFVGVGRGRRTDARRGDANSFYKPLAATSDSRSCRLRTTFMAQRDSLTGWRRSTCHGRNRFFCWAALDLNICCVQTNRRMAQYNVQTCDAAHLKDILPRCRYRRSLTVDNKQHRGDALFRSTCA